VELHILGEGSG
ncbi:hypothetical protein A2U01_0099370, partial [Trifolium medium]|nr:hypothetical protein [Trifolium medium]